jgi:hypothetical protein
MPNPWVNHVKEYASKNNLKYKDALKDPECSASYKSGSGLLGMTQNGMPKPVKPRVLNMTRYGPAGTFSREDVARIDKEDRDRSAMKKAMVNSVTY